MLNYGGFGIPFGAAMLDFADDPRGFYHFVAIDDIAGVGAPPARGPKCGFRSLQYDHRSLRPSTARGPRVLIKSDECGVVSERFRPTARNYRITRKDCVCAYVRANNRLNALQLLSRRQNPFPRLHETIVLGRTEEEGGSFS
jgi:hypothetical protein